MKTRTILILFLGLACVGSFGSTASAQSEKFSALAYLQSGAGVRMVGAGATLNTDIYIDRYSSDAEAKQLEQALLSGGGSAVSKILENMDRIGKVQLTGRVGFYDLKFIRSRKIEGGRRIIAVTDRPISGLEAYYGSRSQDYDIGIMTLDVKPDKKGREKGQGVLIYSAKVKLINGNTVEIENYGVSPAQLRNVRKL
jgi:hypothetical protein